MSTGYPGWRDWTPPKVREQASKLDVSEQTLIAALALPKRTKYRAVKTATADGIVCDSQIEATRWNELKMMEAAGLVRDLLPHPSFNMWVNGKKIGRFSFDSVRTENGEMILEDVKSAATAKHTAYRSRLRTFRACYPKIRVDEVIR